MGLFNGIEFRSDYNLESLRHRLLDKGYITMGCRNNTLRLTPPLTISSWEISRFFETLNGSL